MTDCEIKRAKEELLENISELYLKYGLRSTSMDDICSHLKISKKTLYQFFSNKDDVVESVMLHRRENHRVKRNIEELKRHNSVEMMLLIAKHLINDFNSRLPANQFDLKKYHPDVYERINERDTQATHRLLNELIERGIRDGFFRQDIDRDVQIYLFVKQMTFLGDPETLSAIKYPFEVIVSTIVENVIRSFVTPKGTEELEILLRKHQRLKIEQH